VGREKAKTCALAVCLDPVEVYLRSYYVMVCAVESVVGGAVLDRKSGTTTN
jgi:hypothetical protein